MEEQKAKSLALLEQELAMAMETGEIMNEIPDASAGNKHCGRFTFKLVAWGHYQTQRQLTYGVNV